MEEFDTAKESIEDFHQRFKLCCLVRKVIKHSGTKRRHCFSYYWGKPPSLRDLASLHDITDISLDEIMEFLQTHYWPQTVEIAECFKVFKNTQSKPWILWSL